MRNVRIRKELLRLLTVCIFLLTFMFSSASALENSTLYNGCSGDEVRELQQALIELGYLNGSADGIFGNKTESAVRKFQKKYKLSVDGLAGSVTRSLIMSKVTGKSSVSANVQESAEAPASAESSLSTVLTDNTKAQDTESDNSSLFSGNYTTIRIGSRGDRVKALQKGLIAAGYLKGKADGIFGNQTLAAVKAFQSAGRLTVDGIAGRKTLSALESAFENGDRNASSGNETSAVSPDTQASPDSALNQKEEDINEKISGPASDSVQLLHWFNDIKPVLSNGQHLLVFDPSTGLSWTLRILSRGRHCDAEPLTAKDTRTMVKAFGGVNTWNQKPVYVQLPDGTWTLGSTHDMPHQSGSVKDNDFNGHLCVHFLRDMDEAKKNDPNYGVSNQETIRAYWQKLTGQEITQ